MGLNAAARAKAHASRVKGTDRLMELGALVHWAAIGRAGFGSGAPTQRDIERASGVSRRVWAARKGGRRTLQSVQDRLVHLGTEVVDDRTIVTEILRTRPADKQEAELKHQLGQRPSPPAPLLAPAQVALGLAAACYDHGDRRFVPGTDDWERTAGYNALKTAAKLAGMALELSTMFHPTVDVPTAESAIQGIDTAVARLGRKVDLADEQRDRGRAFLEAHLGRPSSPDDGRWPRWEGRIAGLVRAGRLEEVPKFLLDVGAETPDAPLHPVEYAIERLTIRSLDPGDPLAGQALTTARGLLDRAAERELSDEHAARRTLVVRAYLQGHDEAALDHVLNFTSTGRKRRSAESEYQFEMLAAVLYKCANNISRQGLRSVWKEALPELVEAMGWALQHLLTDGRRPFVDPEIRALAKSVSTVRVPSGAPLRRLGRACTEVWTDALPVLLVRRFNAPPSPDEWQDLSALAAQLMQHSVELEQLAQLLDPASRPRSRRRDVGPTGNPY